MLGVGVARAREVAAMRAAMESFIVVEMSGGAGVLVFADAFGG